MTHFIQNEAQLVDVLRFIDLYIFELLRKRSCVVMLLDLWSHVDFGASRGGEVRVQSIVAHVSNFHRGRVVALHSPVRR